MDETRNARVRVIDENSDLPGADAVVVEEGDLVFTSLIEPGPRGTEGDLEAQVALVSQKVLQVLKGAGVEARHVARLHVYAADPARVAEVESALAAALPPECNPALVILGSALPWQDAAVAMDAVGVAPEGMAGRRPSRVLMGGLERLHRRSPHAVMVPRAPLVFISGRAAGGDVRTATVETLWQLDADLARVGLDWRDVVQMKIFLQPMESADEVLEAIADTLAERVWPAIVFIEWLHGSPPLEIELVAAAGSVTAAPEAELVQYEDSNGRFSRIVQVNEGELIFFGALRGDAGEPAAKQVERQFGRLEQLLGSAGSDIHHLVKATYYVADPAAGLAYNAIRPKTFLPDRAPAASKARIRAAGADGQTSAFDMIAVRPR